MQKFNRVVFSHFKACIVECFDINHYQQGNMLINKILKTRFRHERSYDISTSMRKCLEY